MNSTENFENINEKEEQNQIQIKENNINQNNGEKENKKDNSINSDNSRKNQNYLNEINNKEESIINIDDDNLLISFSNISELNRTNINKEKENKSQYIKSNNKENLNICNYYEFTPENNNNLINNTGTGNNDIKKKNLNYIFNILNSDKKSSSQINNDDNDKKQITQEQDYNTKNEDNSIISCNKKLYDNSNFNFSSLKDMSDIQYKNSNKKGNGNNKKNYIIENTKNINIINSNDKKDKIKYEINNVNNIEIINKTKNNNEKIKKLNDINNTKHLTNFSFGVNNFNIITNNGKNNNGNNHINFDENKMNNIIENNDEYFSPKFNIPNGLNEYKNENELNSIKQQKKKQFEISHIDLSNIINIKGKEPNNNINKGYTDLQTTKGFIPFSIIDKKPNQKANYKKIGINKIKESKNKALSYNKNKKIINKKILFKKNNNIFPSEEELYVNNTTSNIKYKKIKTEKDKDKEKIKYKNIILDLKNKPIKYISNRIKNVNVFNENKTSNKMIDQNLKEKIQNILEKNFELILSNNLLNKESNKRNYLKIKSNSKNSSNCSFNSNCSNSSSSKKNYNNKIKRNIFSSYLYKGNRNYKKLNSKYIFTTSSFNKDYKINNNSFTNKINKKNILKKDFSPKEKNKKNNINNNYNNKLIKNKINNLEKNKTNIIKFIKTKTRNGMKQEKTYIIENKDINIFNIDFNKNNNSLICYNFDKLNNEYNNNQNNQNENSINIGISNSILNNTSNKYKKPVEVISNFKKYKRKKIFN